MARRKKSAKPVIVRRPSVQSIVTNICQLVTEQGWQVKLERLFNRPQFCKDHGVAGSLDNVLGFTEHPEKIVYVDYRHNFFDILIHEYLHALYPNLEEDDIEALEEYVMERLTPTQAKRILRATVPALI
ncbi:hypothetical protein KKF05_01290 [Patescibacteria group bacterium]|nr:hypothetical protein [Patescibacteria group bacterium]MBU1028921.1 hypothetical protein [Patescibacteria group bacterium]MBU1916142.1 hypothetical protein [Patescibacteria group bacterium]